MRAAGVLLWFLGLAAASASPLRLAFSFHDQTSDGALLRYWQPLPESQETDGGDDQDTFFVVLSSADGSPVSLTATWAEWHDAVSFDLQFPDGRTFRISRMLMAVSWNPLRTKIANDRQAIVLPIHLRTGRWDGVPKDLPEKVSLTAHFHLRKSGGVAYDADSLPLTVLTR